MPVVPDTTFAFEKFAVRRSDFAEASVAVRLGWTGDRIRDARISLGAVAPLPIRAKNAERKLVAMARPDPSAIADLAATIVHGSLPLNDNEHKTLLVVELAQRAISNAIGARLGGPA